uniref:Uncharacterized protein n=1 Tax=Meloidogyne enterolobii TaxID=390850 RepID=A0A6V7Y877_MELEN|nr:unnamed protein product [Meloidogyne enterolobii]
MDKFGGNTQRKLNFITKKYKDKVYNPIQIMNEKYVKEKCEEIKKLYGSQKTIAEYRNKKVIKNDGKEIILNDEQNQPENQKAKEIVEDIEEEIEEEEEEEEEIFSSKLIDEIIMKEFERKCLK